MSGLTGELAYQVDRFSLEVHLAVEPGATHVLLGESGAGKTTVVRLLAGLLPLGMGRVIVNDAVYDDTDRGVHIPAEQRSIGYVFQQSRLFPHLTALENVAFPLEAAGTSSSEARKRATGWLERLEIAALAQRRPANISGGEAQRVALARALIREPALLLLDEPLAALDIQTRQRIRHDLQSLLADEKQTTVLVTHDYVDAAVFGRNVQVLDHGHVVQEGTVEDLVARPRTPYVAELAGMNVLRGEARPLGDGACEIRIGKQVLRGSGDARGPAFVSIAPGHITLHRQHPEGSARNVIAGEVMSLIPLADRVRVTIGGELRIVAEITRESASELQLAPGTPVFASFKAGEAEVYQ
ncbi:MAG: ABC transporter ATP-binding protein [Candidatus Dormibacteraeota bacterium]|nr:ABC transporter ATP-binding protein [Candidatus Dormibacteraeota bacterium]